MAWKLPKSWVPGELVTATMFNQELRDELLDLNNRVPTLPNDPTRFLAGDGQWRTVAQGTLVPYTPTWTTNSGSQPSIGNGTLSGEYAKVGRIVHASFIIIGGSTTVKGSGVWFFSVPVAPHPSLHIGGAMMWESGFSNVAMGFWRSDEGSVMSTGGGFVNAADGRTWGTGFEIHGSLTYLSAA